MNYLKLILFPLAWLILHSCSAPKQEKTKENKRRKTDTTAITDTVKKDTIVPKKDIELSSAQKDSIIQNIHLLQSTSFHNDEVDPKLANKEWYGLFEDGNSTLIKKVKVSIESEHDEVVDSEGEQTGWKVSIEEDETVFLVSGLNLEEKKVQSFEFEKNWLQPGDRLSFNFKDKEYTLQAEGDQPEGEDALYKITNFELYLKCGDQSQKLLAIKNNEDATPKVLWVGDLDQDGKLDFIINTTNHYNGNRCTTPKN